MFARFTRLFTLMTLALVLATSILAPSAGPALALATVCKGDPDAALTWLGDKVFNADGGFTDGFKPESSLGATSDAIFAIAAAEGDMAKFKKGNNTPLSYLAAEVKAGKADSAGKLGKVLLAVTAAKQDPKTFGGVDLSKATQDALVKASDGADLFSQSLAMLGLARAGASIPEVAITSLVKAANASGGWGYKAGEPSDTNTSALAVQALIAARNTETVKATLDYFKATQGKDKGWPYQKPDKGDAESDSNSTAAVIQALLAAGEKLSDWQNADDFLKTFQQKSGAFAYQISQPADSMLATVAAIPALCGVAYAPAAQSAATPAATAAK